MEKHFVEHACDNCTVIWVMRTICFTGHLHTIVVFFWNDFFCLNSLFCNFFGGFSQVNWTEKNFQFFLLFRQRMQHLNSCPLNSLSARDTISPSLVCLVSPLLLCVSQIDAFFFFFFVWLCTFCCNCTRARDTANVRKCTPLPQKDRVRLRSQPRSVAFFPPTGSGYTRKPNFDAGSRR